MLEYLLSNAPFEWNLLDDDTKNSTSISELKRILLAMIRSDKNSFYSLNDFCRSQTLVKIATQIQ